MPSAEVRPLQTTCRPGRSCTRRPTSRFRPPLAVGRASAGASPERTLSQENLGEASFDRDETAQFVEPIGDHVDLIVDGRLGTVHREERVSVQRYVVTAVMGPEANTNIGPLVFIVRVLG